jgi:hypothetical protein
VRNLLGWGVPAFAGRIRTGASPSAISPPGSSCSSSPTSHADWHYRSCPSSSCCWRSSASSFSTSPPTPSSRRPSSPTSARCSWGWRFFRQRSNERVLRSDLLEMESELSCGSIFHMNFIASCSGLVSSSLNFTSTLVVRLHELVWLLLRLSGQATKRRVLPRLHLFSFDGLDVASNDEGSFGLTRASRRPPPLASCSTGLPLAPLFPVAVAVFRVSDRPAPGGCSGSCATTALREDAHGRW